MIETIKLHEFQNIFLNTIELRAVSINEFLYGLTITV